MECSRESRDSSFTCSSVIGRSIIHAVFPYYPRLDRRRACVSSTTSSTFGGGFQKELGYRQGAQNELCFHRAPRYRTFLALFRMQASQALDLARILFCGAFFERGDSVFSSEQRYEVRLQSSMQIDSTRSLHLNETLFLYATVN